MLPTYLFWERTHWCLESRKWPPSDLAASAVQVIYKVRLVGRDHNHYVDKKTLFI